MRIWSRVVDVITIGSDSPVRRLIAYYVVLIAIVVGLLYLFPIFNVLFSGERMDQLSAAPQLLKDGLERGTGLTGSSAVLPAMSDRLGLAVTTTLMLLGTLALMLPVSWVYMSTRRTKGYSQAMVQTLIILPVAVCGIVLIVRNSLALAFSLAGIVAGVRFRSTLPDSRDAVFVFLAIGVGLAAGVQAMTVALILSVAFNFILLTVWRSDFGRTVLEPTPATRWVEPLRTLADANGTSHIADRDLLLALSPKKAAALAERFERVRDLVAGENGKRGKKPRYNAVLWVTTEHVRDAQVRVERVLNANTRRWQLDEVETNAGKPSALYYLVRVRKSLSPDELLTAIRAEGGQYVLSAELETGDAVREAAVG
jgi:hypothetical protein